MAIAVISKWLENPDVKSGIKLYQEYGTNSFLKDCFKAGKFGIDRLKKELHTINETLEETKSVSNKKIVRPAEDLPKEVQQLEKKWRDHYATADAIHRDIIHQPMQEDRKKMAFKIVEQMDLVRSIWSKIQYWRENGVLPTEIVASPNLQQYSLLDTIQQIKNLPTYITKLQKKIDKTSDESSLDQVMKDLEMRKNELADAWKRLEYWNEKIKELNL